MEGESKNEEVYVYRIWDKRKKEYKGTWNYHPREDRNELHFEFFNGHTDYEVHEFSLSLHKTYDKEGNEIIPFERIK